MLSKKNIVLGKNKKFLILSFVLILFFSKSSKSSEKFAELNVLDKVSSKTVTIKINIKQEFIFQNLLINVLKCENSEFDDDPEVTAYMQVIDLKDEKKDKVYLFNDWTFASSPSIRPFDHPVYDIWLKKCYS